MSTVSSSLLDLILDLLSNDDELKRFEADPEKFVAEAGYEGCEDDVKDAVKMAGDMRSHSYGADKVSPATRAEHTDYQAVSHVAPAHVDRVSPSHRDHDDHKDHDYKDHDDHKDYDGPRHVEHVTNNHHVDNISNHHYTTNNIDKSHYGDTYGDIEAEGDVVLPGGFHAGEDNEYEGDFAVDIEANQINNSGDGSQVGVGNDASGNAFQNSGNDIAGGGNILEAGDGSVRDSVAASDHSAVNTGTIDNSTDIDASKSDDDVIRITTSDDDVIIKDNVAQFGENNVNDSGLEGVNVDTNASAAGGEDAEVEEVLTLDLGAPELPAGGGVFDPAA